MELSRQGKNPLLQLIKDRMVEVGLINHGKNKVLAEMAGTSESVVSRLLKGSKSISVKNIYSILSALDLLSIDPKARNPTSSQQAFSPKLLNYFPGVEPYIDIINKAADADDYEGVVCEMENCLNNARRALKKSLPTEESPLEKIQQSCTK